MDVRVLLTALLTVVLVVLCHAASDAELAIQTVGQYELLSCLPSLNSYPPTLSQSPHSFVGL